MAMGTLWVLVTPQQDDGHPNGPGHSIRMLRHAMPQPHPYHLCPQVHLGLAGSEGGGGSVAQKYSLLSDARCPGPHTLCPV